jgi:hypothetical protein
MSGSEMESNRMAAPGFGKAHSAIAVSSKQSIGSSLDGAISGNVI